MNSEEKFYDLMDNLILDESFMFLYLGSLMYVPESDEENTVKLVQIKKLERYLKQNNKEEYLKQLEKIKSTYPIKFEDGFESTGEKL